MKFNKTLAQTALTWLVAIATTVLTYLQSGKPFSWPELVSLIVVAGAGLLTTGPGQKTKEQAEALADARARDRLEAYKLTQETHLPPAFPDDPATPD